VTWKNTWSVKELVGGRPQATSSPHSLPQQMAKRRPKPSLRQGALSECRWQLWQDVEIKIWWNNSYPLLLNISLQKRDRNVIVWTYSAGCRRYKPAGHHRSVTIGGQHCFRLLFEYNTIGTACRRAAALRRRLYYVYEVYVAARLAVRRVYTTGRGGQRSFLAYYYYSEIFSCHHP